MLPIHLSRLTLGVAFSAALLAASPARAADVVWSVGLSAPGVQVALAGPPVPVVPPVVYPMAPVVLAPAPVRMGRPVPVVVPAPVVAWAPPHHPHHHHHHHPVHGHAWRRDLNRDGIPDHRQDLNRDGWPDWTARRSGR